MPPRWRAGIATHRLQHHDRFDAKLLGLAAREEAKYLVIMIGGANSSGSATQASAY
jgi:hypothetical protein